MSDVFHSFPRNWKPYVQIDLVKHFDINSLILMACVYLLDRWLELSSKTKLPQALVSYSTLVPCGVYRLDSACRLRVDHLSRTLISIDLFVDLDTWMNDDEYNEEETFDVPCIFLTVRALTDRVGFSIKILTRVAARKVKIFDLTRMTASSKQKIVTVEPRWLCERRLLYV